MALVLTLAPWLLTVLLIVVAAAPAATQPRLSGLKLQTVEAGSLDNPGWARHDPVSGPEPSRRFVEEESMPDWTLLFGVPAHDRDRRGLSFSMRPSYGLKAKAKFRF